MRAVVDLHCVDRLREIRAGRMKVARVVEERRASEAVERARNAMIALVRQRYIRRVDYWKRKMIVN